MSLARDVQRRTRHTCGVRCADGLTGRCVLASVALRIVRDSVNSANDRVVGRDLMCSCVHTFVIVRLECTL